MAIQIGNVIQIMTLVSIIAGIVFGILEIRRASRIRAEKAALDVFDITIQRDIISSLVNILDLPHNASPDEIRKSTELRVSSQLLMNLFEYWGIMVYYRIVPIRTLDLLVGGVVRGSWLRLNPYIESERDVHGIPAIAEWFQWLVDRLEQFPQPEKQLGAHVAFASWKP
jgi:hypothetical protein